MLKYWRYPGDKGPENASDEPIYTPALIAEMMEALREYLSIANANAANSARRCLADDDDAAVYISDPREYIAYVRTRTLLARLELASQGRKP